MVLSGGGSRARKRERRVAKTISQIKANAAARGSHWFDKDTMRFFHSRVSDQVFAGSRCSYFVSSEQYGPGHARRYSVRKACGGQIDTEGKFQGYATLAQAKAAAKRAAQREKSRR